MTEQLSLVGYTEREAAFLGSASLLSGYFLRSQFNAYIGRECGALGQRFIERAIQLGHVTPVLGFGNRVLYHVTARGLYTQLDDADNRNRRAHRPETIRHRLMILDYVVARPAENWLLTRRARREAFGRVTGASREAGGQQQGLLHPTYGQPVSVTADGMLRLAFVDGAVRSLSEWERFLKACRPTLSAMGRAELVYASCEADRFPAAQGLFRRIVVGERADGGIDRDRLQAYFRARRLFEDGRYEGFDQARLDRLREDRRVFARREFELLYSEWRQRGDEALAALKPSGLRFDTQVLPQAYAWLSPIRFQERKVKDGADCGPGEESPRGGHR